MTSLNEFSKLSYIVDVENKSEILLRDAIEIGFLACRTIMNIYNGINTKEWDIRYKESDNSPVTIADLRANDVICNQLISKWPEIPIISEESDIDEWEIRKGYKVCWLVDPLDGTKEFIKQNGEFTVNIGLSENGIPTFGLVCIPEKGIAYISNKNLEGAYKIITKDASNIICDRVKLDFIPKSNHSKEPNEVIRIMNSPNYQNAMFFSFIEKYFPKKSVKSFGSSLKFIEIAEGRADVYPRFLDCMEWDTCACHIILKQTCGEIYELEVMDSGSDVKFLIGKPLVYNKKSLLNPFFIAVNDRTMSRYIN